MAVGTTRGKRRLGAFVKSIMVRSALRVGDVADQTGCSRQTMARLLSGESLPRMYLFKQVLGVINATAEEHRHAEELWEIANANTAVIEHAEEMPAKYRRFRLDELEAQFERTFDPMVFPGLLTTHEYASAVAHGRRTVYPADNWAEHAAAERRERRALLARPVSPLHLHALVDWSVLTRIVGDSTIMAAQLDHVLVVAEYPNVTIQVIPSDFGAHGAMSSPFILFSYPGDDADEAYVESFLGNENVGKASDVVTMSAVWAEIAAAAPSPVRSMEIIREVRDKMKYG
jgi:transcriptional regulator with XRE-family HTH domain